MDRDELVERVAEAIYATDGGWQPCSWVGLVAACGEYPENMGYRVIQAHRAKARAALAIIEPAVSADDWQPIETAPRDGTEVLVYATMPDHLQWADPDKQLRPVVRVTAWHPDAGWCVDELREASHWRPLPKGPGG